LNGVKERLPINEIIYQQLNVNDNAEDLFLRRIILFLDLRILEPYAGK